MYKLLIVDDEAAIRKGLINFIDWKAMDCEVAAEATNGLEALEKIEQSLPDIIICDVKMPGLSGIELAGYIHEKHPDKKVIILTGYADFFSAQTALKYGVVDFVLKPTEIEQLKEAVEKAKNAIRLQRENKSRLLALENEVIESRFKLKEKLVNDIIEGLVYSPESISQRCSELGIHFSEYYVMVYEMEDHKPADSGNKDGGVFTSSIINLLSTSFKDFQHIIVPVRSYCLCSVVSFSEASARECQQTILEVSREILSTVEGFMGFSLSIGISGKHASLTELYGAYREAVQALDEKFFNNAESCISIFSQCSKNMSSEEKGMTNQYLESILHAVKEGNRDISASMVKELLEKLRMGKLPIDLIKNICIHLCSSLETLLYNYNMNLSDCIPNENGIYGNILEAQSIRGLSDILINITNAVSFRLSELEHQNNYIIKKVTGYIYENYRSDIKLKTLADFVHISSSYLSRMFRKETGDTITDTISKIRMEKAKELIRNSGMKTYEVACAVGINDAAYFSVLFKKYAGVSPKDYKYLDPE